MSEKKSKSRPKSAGSGQKDKEKLKQEAEKVIKALYKAGGKAELHQLMKKLDMPEWMECSWRRKACEKPDCKICGPIIKHRQKRLGRGLEPDSLEAAFEFVEEKFDETRQMIEEMAEEEGIDLENLDSESLPEEPRPEEFPLFKRVGKWRKNLAALADEAWENEELWVFTNEGQDLLWYMNTLCSKTFRQLINNWDMEHLDEGTDLDFVYTQYVLRQCVDILNKALKELVQIKSPQQGGLLLMLASFEELQEEILSIKPARPLEL